MKEPKTTTIDLTEKASLVNAGKALRAIRESKRKSQEDVSNLTRIQLSRLSLIERGKVSKPPSLRDMAELAFQYGLSPRSVFEIYGLPIVKTAVSDPEDDEPEQLVALRSVLRELPDETSRAEILGMLGWVVDMANAKIQMFAKGEHDDEANRRAVRAKA